MKKKLMILTAIVLCIAMLIMPLQVAAAPQEEQKVYVSEVKVGMGETSEEAAKELLAEGFTILTDPDGSYSDLNYETGTKSGMRYGPTQKIVYIGYKTTTNPKEAITDLAVMNMNGGYSVQDYLILMENHLYGEIIPFVERFIATLNEYRANLKKPKNSLNYIRANYYRQMLNKLTDDDTGKTLGDLLINETKYEMGDDKYNALSDKEKKNHADILTLLMQGNGKAVILLEMFITKASDDGDDTWIDRFLKISTDELKAQVKKENPSLTTDADVLSELDKRYNDTARKIVEKWDYFTEAALAYDDTVNEVMNTDLEIPEVTDEEMEKLGDDEIEDEEVDTIEETVTTAVDISIAMKNAEEATVIQYLDSTEYEDGTLLEFFTRDKSELIGEGIRSLYPIAAALSKGQIAGLDFLSIVDMVSMAIANEDGFDLLAIDGLEPASFYQDVDREIYEPGGVAMTTAALRNNANKKDTDEGFCLSNLGIALWVFTGVSAVTAAVSFPISNYLAKQLPKAIETFNKASKTLSKTLEQAKQGMNSLSTGRALSDYDKALANKIFYSTNSKVTYYLGVCMTFVAAVLAAYSIYTTISEMLEYYNVVFTPIPRYMVDEADITETVNGVTKVINNQTAYYKVVSCNRKEGSSETEQDNFRVLGTANDLNGDVGKQWLALYSVKYENGYPILADSLMVQKGSDKLPNGYETGIHRFGEGGAFNLTSEYYCYNDKPEGTYVYFKNDTETVGTMTTTGNSILDMANTSGSLISKGSLALAGGLGLLIGAGIAALIFLPIMKKKKATVEAE